MPDPLSPKELEHFVGILEQPDASETLKKMAQHLVQMYFKEGAQAAGREWLRLRARNDLDSFSEFVFGYKPAAHHKEITKILSDPRRKRTVIVAHPQSAKCFPLTERVSMADGSVKAGADLKVGDKVASIDTETLRDTSGEVLWVERTGKKQCLSIFMESGRTIQVTGDHRILTFDGWKKAEDVTEDDYLAARKVSPDQTPSALSDAEIRLLAMWVAEGCRAVTQKHSFVVANTEEDLISEVEQDGESLGYYATRKLRGGELVGASLNRGTAPKHPAQTILLANGLDPKTCGAHDKFIPVEIMRASNRQAALFLNRLYACDGTIYTKTSGGRASSCVEYASASLRLIEDIRDLLLRFGILGRVHELWSKDGTGSGERFQSWKLSISEGYMVHRFMGLIGMKTKDSRFDAEARQRTESSPANGKSEQIPPAWRGLLKKSVHHYSWTHKIRVDKPGRTALHKVAAVAELEQTVELDRIVRGDVQWVKVRSIADAGVLETMDIEVEGTHCFYQNGVVSHNSTYVSLIYPLFEAGRDPDGSIILLCEAFTQAERYNSQIRPILKGQGEAGEKFLEVFPEVRSDEDQGWTREKLYLANRTKNIPHPNLYFSGASSGSIQGARASVILLDDVVSIDTVASPTEMKKVRDRIQGVVIPRLYPTGRVISVCTRWAANDLVELFLQHEDFEMLYMPALTDDPKGAYVDFIPSKSYLRYPQPGEKAQEAQWVRHPDPEAYIQQQLAEVKAEAEAEGYRAEITVSEANYSLPCVRKYLHADNDPVLWPELFSKEALEQKRQTNSVSFRLVYNGDPTGISGDIFKREWFRTYGGEDDVFKTVPIDHRVFMSVDISVGNSKKGQGDYFVVLVVAVDNFGNKFIIDCYRDKILPPYQRKKIAQMYEIYPETVGILIETTAYQAALFHELAAEGLPVIETKPIKKKEVRIESSSVFWQQGKVFLPYHAAWKDAFIDEHTQFPRGKHDDQIDAGAQLFEFLSTYRTIPETLHIGFG